MTADEFHTLLKSWGIAFGGLAWSEETESREEGLPGSTHPLARRIVPPEDRPRRRRRRRRAFLGADGAPRSEPAPVLVCYGKESRPSPAPHRFPSELEAIELAVQSLYKIEPLQGVVVRIEYCTHGLKHREKAQLVSRREGVGRRVSLSLYRTTLSKAEAWLFGHLSPRKVA